MRQKRSSDRRVILHAISLQEHISKIAGVGLALPRPPLPSKKKLLTEEKTLNEPETLQTLLSKYSKERPSLLKPKKVSLAAKLNILEKINLPGFGKQKHEELPKVPPNLANPCPICLKPFSLYKITSVSCGHFFHSSCFSALIQHAKVTNSYLRCPMCRKINPEFSHCLYSPLSLINNACIKIQRSVRRFLYRVAFFDRLIDLDHKSQSKKLKRKLLLRKMDRINRKIGGWIKSNSQGEEDIKGTVDRAIALIEEREKGIPKKWQCIVCKKSAANENEAEVLLCGHKVHFECGRFFRGSKNSLNCIFCSSEKENVRNLNPRGDRKVE